jgi:hypothetical protein
MVNLYQVTLVDNLPASTTTTNVTQYEMPDEVMRWQPPECFKCHERKFNYTEIPYDSDYAGEIICGDCFHKHCDPGIKAALAKKEDKVD